MGAEWRKDSMRVNNWNTRLSQKECIHWSAFCVLLGTDEETAWYRHRQRDGARWASISLKASFLQSRVAPGSAEDEKWLNFEPCWGNEGFRLDTPLNDITGDETINRLDSLSEWKFGTPQMFREVSGWLRWPLRVEKVKKRRGNVCVRIQHPLWGITFSELEAGKGRETAALRANLKWSQNLAAKLCVYEYTLPAQKRAT